MSNLKKRLDNVQERVEFQAHKYFAGELEVRSEEEQRFFCINGYWPETVTELPRRIEFTARGIKTIVTTEWEDENEENATRAGVGRSAR